MFVFGTVFCWHIHQSWIQRSVLSVKCVQDETQVRIFRAPIAATQIPSFSHSNVSNSIQLELFSRATNEVENRSLFILKKRRRERISFEVPSMMCTKAVDGNLMMVSLWQKCPTILGNWSFLRKLGSVRHKDNITLQHPYQTKNVSFW